jgi:osmotically inducible lipoprotein OsmB
MQILYVVRNFKSRLIVLLCALSIATLTGCYAGGFTPRETGTVGGAALGAGGGALIGSAVGAPGTGAVIGGLGGGLAGYLVGNSVQERDYRDGYQGNGYYGDGYRGYY